jgi:hypothetical protein
MKQMRQKEGEKCSKHALNRVICLPAVAGFVACFVGNQHLINQLRSNTRCGLLDEDGRHQWWDHHVSAKNSGQAAYGGGCFWPITLCINISKQIGKGNDKKKIL